MKLKPLKLTALSLIITIGFTTLAKAQEGRVIINQDQKINALIDVKKNMNLANTDRYKIQIYSGNRKTAEKRKSNFINKYADWKPAMVFETPNYKIWVGNFRTRLEADRALKKIKNNFSSAFIFKPKKEK